MFKNIRAIFRLGIKDYKVLTIEIERHESGASPYGDKSAHDIFVNDNWYKSFDTRYDRIPTTQGAWLKEWIDWIMENWFHNEITEFELIQYKETEVEEKIRK